MKSLRLPVAGAILALFSSLSHGANIPVPNYDFSAQGTGEFFNNGPSTLVTGFTVTSNGNNFGVLDRPDPNISGNVTAGFANGDNGAPVTFTTDTLGTTIAANTTYTFSLDIGDLGGTDNTYDESGTVTFGLLANGTPTGVMTLVPAGTVSKTSSLNYENFSYSFTTGVAGGFIGQDLEAQFSATPTGQSQTYFDNLQLTATSVPEPSTYAMTFGGLGMLVLVSRFRNKLTA
jgi:hypothetical protein